MKLDELLATNHIPFERLHHPPAYTAQRVARFLHIPVGHVAKTVFLRTADGYALAVLPANRRVDMVRAGQCLGKGKAELADEAEMEQVFQDCECGAMPPFGSIYHLPTVVDESLARDESIVFEAQCHEKAIRMAYRDFEAIEHPRTGSFTVDA